MSRLSSMRSNGKRIGLCNIGLKPSSQPTVQNHPKFVSNHPFAPYASHPIMTFWIESERTAGLKSGVPCRIVKEEGATESVFRSVPKTFSDVSCFRTVIIPGELVSEKRESRERVS